ncbi:MAG: C1 family peptidase [Clostridia bacterium]|nr:C1 family peptidase [Clostridia bacterium]
MKKTVLPAYASLWGTTHCPSIDNQGAIGSCASQAITRTQFSNAFSRHLHKIDADSTFSPRDDKNQCFAPKFTFTLSGAGTIWVYEILKEHGCVFTDDCAFSKDEKGGHRAKDKEGNLYTQTTCSPAATEGLMEKAMENRISNFEQIWFTKPPYNEKLTTSEEGRKLVERIKAAIVHGDAVVTGGYPSRWIYGKLDGCGNIGKVGENTIVAASGSAGGGHQVTIIGYDDEVTATFAGVKMRGAFLVANSYGEGWMNGGLTWAMYDALNTVSEFAALNNGKLYSGRMSLTPAQDMCMFPGSLATANQLLAFKAEGSVTVAGKEYTAYTIQDDASRKYLCYKKEASDRSLYLSDENEGCRFVLLPYADIMGWEKADAANRSEEFEKSVWVYAVDKEGDEYGFKMLDAGLGFSSSGRKVGIATHNGGRYPAAKSWELSAEPAEEFTAKLSITAGKDVEAERNWVFDQFAFLNWEKDMNVGMPAYYVKATVNANDRDCFKLVLTRKEKGKAQAKTYVPALFRYAEYHPIFCDRKKGEYLNFEGVKKGGMATGYFAFPLDELLKLPKGKSFTDYEWGIRLKKGRKGKAELIEASLLTGNKEVLASGKGNEIVFEI